MFDEMALFHMEVSIACHEIAAYPDRANEIAKEIQQRTKQRTTVWSLHLQGALERASGVEKRLATRQEQMLRGYKKKLASVHTPEGKVPDPHGFYVYTLWQADEPLYVGQSRNIYARLGAHMSDREKRRRTTSISLSKHSTIKRMDDAEWHLIAELNPALNIMGNTHNER